jgi:fermentation-respiration switch protein FrsA (DUF1100 family)
MVIIKSIFIFLGIGYIALMLAALLLSGIMTYPAPKTSYRDASGVLKIPTERGDLITALYLPNPEARYTILYSHGNGEDLGYIEPTLRLYLQKGYTVFAYDYPGYGTSKGSPSETSVIQAIDAAYRYLTQEIGIDPNQIIALGRSLGSGPSVNLASRMPVGGLILESGFVSSFRVLTRYPLLPWDKYRNLTKMNSIRCPVLVIHGKRDQIVAFWHGEALYEAANEPKSFLWVDNARHNNLLSVAGTQYWMALNQFRQKLDEVQMLTLP